MITNTSCQLIKTGSGHKFKSPPCGCTLPNIEHFALGTIVQCINCQIHYKLYKSGSYIQDGGPYAPPFYVKGKTYWRKMFWRNLIRIT